MPTSDTKFVLSRAKAEDLEDIIDLCYDSFSREETNLYMGCPDRTNLPKYRQRCLDIMEKDKSDVWMHVKDVKTGKMIACSNWKIYVNGKPDDHGEEVIDWAGPEQHALSAKVVKIMNENRWRNMPGPFIRESNLAHEYRLAADNAPGVQICTSASRVRSIDAWAQEP